MRGSLLSHWLGVTTPTHKCRVGRGRYRPIFDVLEERALLSSYHVTNAGDSGAGSLRQAIIDSNANAAGGPNRIDFSASVHGPINLVTALAAIDNNVTLATGDDHNITVERSSATGTPDFRIFTINAGRTVNITGLTIANGLVLDDSGGGILNNGTLVLDHSVVTGNTATSDQPYVYAGGGGIENLGTLSVRESVIKNNVSSGNGAGIQSAIGTTLTIDDSVISGNTSSNNGSLGAGGLASAAVLTVRDSLISGNTGGVGGVTVYGVADVLIWDTSIVENHAPAAGVTAGIFDGDSGKVVLANSSVSSNTGGTAGGINTRFLRGAVLEIIDSKINGNTGQNDGGAFIDFKGNVLIEDSTIRDNTGSVTGGIALFSTSDSVLIEDSTISDNVGGAAGGVYSVTDLQIVRSTISGNIAIANNQSGAAGGVFGYATIENSTISGNTVVANNMYSFNGSGVAAGGVCAIPGTATSIDHSTIAFNKVVGVPNGNLQISGGVTSQAQTLTYQNNGTTYSLPLDADVSVHDTIIAKNQASIGEPDVAGAFQSQGHNLIGVLGSGASGFVASDLHGTPSAPLDPRLLPLGWYGGPTQTLALAENSPAINAGDNTNAPATDQRGRPRIVGGTIDIGSYERGQGGDDGHHDCDAGALLDAVFADFDHLLNWQGR